MKKFSAILFSLIIAALCVTPAFAQTYDEETTVSNGNSGNWDYSDSSQYYVDPEYKDYVDNYYGYSTGEEAVSALTGNYYSDYYNNYYTGTEDADTSGWTYYRSLRQIPDKQLDFALVDNAELLDTSDAPEVLAMLEDAGERLQMSIVIVTVNSTGTYTAMAYADDFYDYNGYGYGENRDGILLLVAMDTRDYYVSTSGSCIEMFGDKENKYLDKAFLPDLSNGDYCSSFEAFITAVEKIADGTYSKNQTIKVFLICLVVCSLLSTIIVMAIAKSSTKPVKLASDADDYRIGGLMLRENRDIFLYKNVVKTYNPPAKSSGSGSSGGSSHTSSSGSSHGGHGGKF